MTFLEYIEKKILHETFGAIATASLLICSVSGIVLAIPFDISQPFESLKILLVSNSAAVFFRNLHYWSAQGFLIFILLHFWEHFFRHTEKKVKRGVWFRLLISIFFIFFVMLSGFILKGDADSMQAFRIFDSLLKDIPGGKYISRALLGKENNFQLLYVNHVATATIFIFIVTFEHAKTIWTRMSTFLISLLVFLIFSYLFHAPLQDHASGIIKGPWYFLGLQEILHWTRYPQFVNWALFIVFLILFIVRKMKIEKGIFVKYFLLALFAFYMFLTIIGYFFRGENWEWTWNVQHAYNPFNPVSINADAYNIFSTEFASSEGCIQCHGEVSGFSASHDPNAIGCSSCHLGNPFTPDKDEAHRNMVLFPGDLKYSEKTCGTVDCHPDIVERMQSNIMTTNSGMVSVDRFVFGESDSLSGRNHIQDIGHSAAAQHLRDMCAHCHLGNPKVQFETINEKSRGGGCIACHLNYSQIAEKELISYLNTARKDTFLMLTHPELSLNISNDHCFGCHSRSGRISTNFEGWHETTLKSIPDSGDFRKLEDKRIFRKEHADIHFEKGMLCVDCHSSYALMGDGKYYSHKEEQVKISCKDCHFEELPQIADIDELDFETRKILELKGWDTINHKVIIGKSGYPIVNSFVVPGEQPMLMINHSAKFLPLNPPLEKCLRDNAHSGLSCQSCHSKWVPQCIGCHNEFDSDIAGYDLLEGEEKEGSWVEYVGEYFASEPVLGVIDEPGKDREIYTFTPGMIMTIDKSSFEDGGNEIFHRLFAPSDPHTTSLEGRSCKDCHINPLMIGYGRGELIYNTSSGSFTFNPRFSNEKEDNLPQDAWIGFLLDSGKEISSTRYYHRPFNIDEQKKVLLAGSCLFCHDGESEVMKRSLNNFQEVLDQRSENCIIPEELIP
ncbi:cytochrome b N-terminal domain-containing protein [Bacteroidota bacterium]